MNHQWISVEDRLPKEEELFLVCRGAVCVVALWWGDEQWMNDNEELIDDVTHWQPLPEPPETE